MPNMTQAEFYQVVDKVYRDNPTWRGGQALFNTLVDIRPDIAEAIRATANDPFYGDDWADDRVVAATKVINLMWGDNHG